MEGESSSTPAGRPAPAGSGWGPAAQPGLPWLPRSSALVPWGSSSSENAARRALVTAEWPQAWNRHGLNQRDTKGRM